jgi:AcrR family transcriptional regulator
MVVLLPSGCDFPDDDMPSRPSVEPGSSRSRLLHAAKRLFAAKGYEQTATSAIAREAGTSESQLMRYFGGKVGLLDALFHDAWAELNQKVRETAAAAPTPRHALLDLLIMFAASLGRDADLAALFLFEGRRMRGDTPRVRVAEGFHGLADLARTLVRKGQASREIDHRLDPAAVTSALLGACEAMVRDRVLARSARGRVFAEREIRRTLEAMLAGMAGSRPPSQGLRRRRP